LALLGVRLPPDSLSVVQLSFAVGLRDSGLLRIIRGHRRSLKVLEVRGCFQLSDGFAVSLAHVADDSQSNVCERMKLFAISETGRFSSAGLRALTKIFPNLVSLEMTKVRSIKDVSALGDFAKLREVNLNFCEVCFWFSECDFR
jgi:hypothetical protein